MWLEERVESIEHHARLHRHGGVRRVFARGFGIKRHHVAQPFGVVDDQGLADCLAALGGTAATRKHRHL